MVDLSYLADLVIKNHELKKENEKLRHELSKKDWDLCLESERLKKENAELKSKVDFLDKKYKDVMEEVRTLVARQQAEVKQLKENEKLKIEALERERSYQNVTAHTFHPSSLTFDGLRAANKRRLPQFKNKKGLFSHARADGSDWSLNDWMTAITGEAGELASILKSVRRGDLSLNIFDPSSEDVVKSLANEMADIITYVDLLAFQLDINLGEAVRNKFNEVSKRVGSDASL